MQAKFPKRSYNNKKIVENANDPLDNTQNTNEHGTIYLGNDYWELTTD